MINVLVESTNFSEKNMRMFSHLNESVRGLDEFNMIYVNLSSQVSHAEFSIMNITELNNCQGGMVVATCPMTADILGKAPVNTVKAYYMWDLSFLLRAYDFDVMHTMLSKVNLIVRSEAHKKIIQSLFNLDVNIVPFFRFDAICNSQLSTKND
jgi:hypothetical protein